MYLSIHCEKIHEILSYVSIKTQKKKRKGKNSIGNQRKKELEQESITSLKKFTQWNATKFDSERINQFFHSIIIIKEKNPRSLRQKRFE